MGNYDDLKLAIEAVDREAGALQLDYAAALSVIVGLQNDVAGLEAQLADCQASKPPTSIGFRTTIGIADTKWPAGVAPRENARCYQDSQITKAIANKSRVFLISPTPSGMQTVAQAVTKVKDVLAKAKAAGITNAEVRYTMANEVNRPNHCPAGAKAYVQRLREISAELQKIEGASTWINITYYGLKDGSVAPFAAEIKPADKIGYAINSYSPGRDKNPCQYTPYSQWLDTLLDFVASTGVKDVASWEAGTEINGVAPAGTPKTRPDYIYGQIKYSVEGAEKRGLKFWDWSYWNNVLSVNGQPDPAAPDNRLMTDEPATSEALQRAAADFA